MGISNKYNAKERLIARKLQDYKRRQTALTRLYYECEMKINVCKTKLNGKYGRDKKY